MSQVCGVPEEQFLAEAIRLSEANRELSFEEVWYLWKSQIIQPTTAMEEEFEDDYAYAECESLYDMLQQLELELELEQEPKPLKKSWADIVSGSLKKN